MASTNKTLRGLSLWVEDDIPTMEDFNDDNQTVDSLIGDLEEDIDALEYNLTEVETRFSDGKAKEALRADTAKKAGNGVTNQPFSIPAEAWTDSAAFVTHAYETVIPVAELKATDDALLLFRMQDVAGAREAGITDGLGETLEGGVRLYAEQRPASALGGTLSVIHREVE